MTNLEAALDLSPIRKSILIARPPAVVFDSFTRGMGRWWPIATHSVGRGEVRTVTFEEGVGGRVYERLHNGTEYEWGRVLTWEPPHRLAMTWHPGRDATSAQHLEVTFQAEGAGTRLELVHSDWERLGSGATGMRNNYQSGWDYVLSCLLRD